MFIKQHNFYFFCEQAKSESCGKTEKHNNKNMEMKHPTPLACQVYVIEKIGPTASITVQKIIWSKHKVFNCFKFEIMKKDSSKLEFKFEKCKRTHNSNNSTADSLLGNFHLISLPD